MDPRHTGTYGRPQAWRGTQGSGRLSTVNRSLHCRRLVEPMLGPMIPVCRPWQIVRACTRTCVTRIACDHTLLMLPGCGGTRGPAPSLSRYSGRRIAKT